jgi:predicted DNA-binding protein YlxM (UPF0122 family)
MQQNLRKQVKMLKALQNISYTEIAELLEISRSAMYNWLKEQYNLSQTKADRLQEIIETLKEV